MGQQFFGLSHISFAYPSQGCCGMGIGSQQAPFSIPCADRTMVRVCCGPYYTVFQDRSATLFGCGMAGFDLFSTSEHSVQSLSPLKGLSGPILGFSCGHSHFVALSGAAVDDVVSFDDMTSFLSSDNLIMSHVASKSPMAYTLGLYGSVDSQMYLLETASPCVRNDPGPAAMSPSHRVFWSFDRKRQRLCLHSSLSASLLSALTESQRALEESCTIPEGYLVTPASSVYSNSTEMGMTLLQGIVFLIAGLDISTRKMINDLLPSTAYTTIILNAPTDQMLPHLGVLLTLIEEIMGTSTAADTMLLSHLRFGRALFAAKKDFFHLPVARPVLEAFKVFCEKIVRSPIYIDSALGRQALLLITSSFELFHSPASGAVYLADLISRINQGTGTTTEAQLLVELLSRLAGVNQQGFEAFVAPIDDHDGGESVLSALLSLTEDNTTLFPLAMVLSERVLRYMLRFCHLSVRQGFVGSMSVCMNYVQSATSSNEQVLKFSILVLDVLTAFYRLHPSCDYLSSFIALEEKVRHSIPPFVAQGRDFVVVESSHPCSQDSDRFVDISMKHAASVCFVLDPRSRWGQSDRLEVHGDGENSVTLSGNSGANSDSVLMECNSISVRYRSSQSSSNNWGFRISVVGDATALSTQDSFAFTFVYSALDYALAVMQSHGDLMLKCCEQFLNLDVFKANGICLRWTSADAMECEAPACLTAESPTAATSQIIMRLNTFAESSIGRQSRDEICCGLLSTVVKFAGPPHLDIVNNVCEILLDFRRWMMCEIQSLEVEDFEMKAEAYRTLSEQLSAMMTCCVQCVCESCTPCGSFVPALSAVIALMKGSKVATFKADLATFQESCLRVSKATCLIADIACSVANNSVLRADTLALVSEKADVLVKLASSSLSADYQDSIKSSIGRFMRTVTHYAKTFHSDLRTTLPFLALVAAHSSANDVDLLDVCSAYPLLEVKKNDAQADDATVSFSTDIAALAQVTVSSSNSLVGRLLDGDTDTFWQTDGSRPHWIQLNFDEDWKVQSVQMYVDYERDRSYCPKKVCIEITHDGETTSAGSTVVPVASKGWVSVSADEEVPFICRSLKVLVQENQDGGTNSKVRGLRVFGSRVDESVEILSSTFSTLKSASLMAYGSLLSRMAETLKQPQRGSERSLAMVGELIKNFSEEASALSQHFDDESPPDASVEENLLSLLDLFSDVSSVPQVSMLLSQKSLMEALWRIIRSGSPVVQRSVLRLCRNILSHVWVLCLMRLTLQNPLLAKVEVIETLLDVTGKAMWPIPSEDLAAALAAGNLSGMPHWSVGCEASALLRHLAITSQAWADLIFTSIRGVLQALTSGTLLKSSLTAAFAQTVVAALSVIGGSLDGPRVGATVGVVDGDRTFDAVVVSALGDTPIVAVRALGDSADTFVDVLYFVCCCSPFSGTASCRLCRSCQFLQMSSTLVSLPFRSFRGRLRRICPRL